MHGERVVLAIGAGIGMAYVLSFLFPETHAVTPANRETCESHGGVWVKAESSSGVACVKEITWQEKN